MQNQITRTALKCERVDQVGSLVNPASLLAAYSAHERSEVSTSVLMKAQDEAVAASIRRQGEIGLRLISDGEMRRRNFQDNFANSVWGFQRLQQVRYVQPEVSRQPFARAEQNFSAADGAPIFTRRKVVEKLRLIRNVALEEYKFAAALTSHPVKATVLSPDRIAQRFAYEESTNIYPDLASFMDDVVAISREIIAQLAEAGCRYIQVDAPGYTSYVDPVSIERMRSRGENPAVNLAISLAAENEVIRGFPDVVFGIHICRGNARTRDAKTGEVVAQFHREGHYDGIAEQLFSTLNHDRWLLEYDSERAGSFAALRFLRKEHIAVLGLVTTKNSRVEGRDEVLRRIDEASQVVSTDRLAISPQCGFGGVGHETVTEDEQWRKFERLIEASHEVWR